MGKALVILSLLVSTLSVAVFPAGNVHAGVVGFKAGQIMDDTVMTNANSMSVSDIQRFLNSKVPSCDTNGQKLSEYGGPDLNGDGKVQRWEWGKAKYNQTTFPCLKDKTFDGKKAAQVIYEKAQKYTINPQSLIVLLQKEQGLVTDTWPLNIQYRSATGYGCPDGAPCASEYYGLVNQLEWAAKMFHSIITQNPNWYSPYIRGSNPKVYWHPSGGNYINTSGKNDSRAGCGYNSLDIKNWTTASLYSYTPYRPNSAALNAGYGTGDACSAYGNRNFYLYFTDWFGTTTNTLFKIQGSGDTIYLNWRGAYYPIPSMKVLRAYGLSDTPVATLSSSQLQGYTQGPPLSQIAKFGTSATVYLIDNGLYSTVPDMETLQDYGFTGSDSITYSDPNLIEVLNPGESLTTLARQSNGAIYHVSAGKKHLFPDGKTFNIRGPQLTGDSTLSVTNFSDEFINNLIDGSPILINGSFVKARDSATIYLYEQGKLFPFTYADWEAWGKKADYTNFLSNNLRQIPVEAPAPVLIGDGTTRYLVANGKKYSFDSVTQTVWGIENSRYRIMSNESMQRLTEGGQMGTLVQQASGAASVIRNGKLVLIPSGKDFTGLGFSWEDVIRVNDNITRALPFDTDLAFAPGSLVRLPDGSISWIDIGFKKYIIPSMDRFNSFGFKTTDVRGAKQNVLSGYASEQLSYLLEVPVGTYYLVDRGERLAIGGTAYGSTQYNFGTKARTQISSTLLSKMRSGPALTRFIKGSSMTVYGVANGQKKPFNSQESFFANGGTWGTVTHVSDVFLSTLPTGSSY